MSVSVSKLGKSSIVFVEEGATVTAEYYRDGILEVLIPEMDRLAKRKPYLFMQDGARSHTAKSTLELLHSQRHLELLEPDMWPPNSPDLNPVDFSIWGALEDNVYRGRRITSLDELRTAIEEEWEAFPQDHINRAIDSFKPRLKRVIEENGGHIENYYE